eukprot:3915415-Amphidinium_carterae.3
MQHNSVESAGELTNDGPRCGPDTSAWAQQARRTAHARHHQPRGQAIPQLIGEFKCFVELPCHETLAVGAKRRTLGVHPRVPLGSKLLAVNIGDGGFAQQLEGRKCLSCGCSATEMGLSGCMGKRSRYGIFHTPAEWHEIALKLKFPMDGMPFARPWQVRAMRELLESTPAQVVARRSNMLQSLIQKIGELKDEEVRIRTNMPVHVERIMRGKRILLFESVLKDAGIDDPDMIKGLRLGFSLIGQLPSAGWFPRRKEGVVAVKIADLVKESEWRVPRLEASCRASRDPKDDEELWKQCEEEVARGWSRGPYTREEVDAIHGRGQWVAAKRFAIWQSAAGRRKLRVIDDYSVSGQNSTVVPAEKLDHAGLDEIIAIIRCMGSALEKGQVKVVDVHGGEHTIKAHGAWRGGTLNLRTIDLKHAYKQLAVASEELRYTMTCMYGAEKKEAVYWQNLALPFGATGSVYEFNSVARALEIIICNWVGTVTSSFFDDYSLVEPSVTADSASSAVEALLRALGWLYDSEGSKYNPFSQSAVVLGVALEIRVADLVVANTARRIQQVLEEIDDIIAKGMWGASDAAKLAGRLNFCRAFVSGRHLNITLWDVFQRAAGEVRKGPITESEVKALTIIRGYMCTAEPKILKFSPVERVVLLYTDGAIEENFAGVGAVLCLPGGDQPLRVISVHIPEHLTARWKSRSKHAVAEAEMLPALLARSTWEEELRGSSIIHFTDNSSVKEALVKGTSSNLSNRQMLLEIAKLDASLKARWWVCRVPTQSNPADAPSRLQSSFFPGRQMMAQDKPVWPAFLTEGLAL